MADFQPIFIRGAIINDQLRHRLHPEEARSYVPQASHPVLPQLIPEEHALLQDLQLGQPYWQPRSALDAGCREVGLMPIFFVYQLGEAPP